MEKLSKKQIWNRILQVNPSGSEYVDRKAVIDKMIANADTYIKKETNRQKQAAIFKQKKNNIAMEKLNSGEQPATQKQIDYIESLLKKSKLTYDFNFQRDKYTLNKKIASLFINALIKGEDFKVHLFTKNNDNG